MRSITLRTGRVYFIIIFFLRLLKFFSCTELVDRMQVCSAAYWDSDNRASWVHSSSAGVIAALDRTASLRAAWYFLSTPLGRKNKTKQKTFYKNGCIFVGNPCFLKTVNTYIYIFFFLINKRDNLPTRRQKMSMYFSFLQRITGAPGLYILVLEAEWIISAGGADLIRMVAVWGTTSSVQYVSGACQPGRSLFCFVLLDHPEARVAEFSFSWCLQNILCRRHACGFRSVSYHPCFYLDCQNTEQQQAD